MDTDIARIRELEQALRDMHSALHDHVYRCGSYPGIPESRVIGKEAFRKMLEIMVKQLGRQDKSLKYFNCPGDPKCMRGTYNCEFGDEPHALCGSR